VLPTYSFRDSKNHGDRDIFNERPTQEEAKMALAHPLKGSGPSPIAYNATIHTSVGDIHIQLFPDQAPKTVENFVGHARSGYFERVIFHRVIAKFVSDLL
jgi:peptidylprolyl isomerase domain and WD repeat-containing protein 1